MKSILPQNCHFVMKNQHCRKYCHFQNFFAKKLPLIRQRSAIFSVKHLATLLPLGESQYHHLSFSYVSSFSLYMFCLLCSSSCKATRNKDRHSRDVWSQCEQGFINTRFLELPLSSPTIISLNPSKPQMVPDRRLHNAMGPCSWFYWLVNEFSAGCWLLTADHGRVADSFQVARVLNYCLVQIRFRSWYLGKSQWQQNKMDMVGKGYVWVVLFLIVWILLTAPYGATSKVRASHSDKSNLSA